jgi:aminoglycoside phosphotransferase family enzyme/predicted kinase
MSAAQVSRELVDALVAGDVLGPGSSAAEIIETHISWVILAGEDAWKIKKPVRFGFVDFSSLEARRAACNAELRLNRRLTPAVYHDVVPIHGTAQAPTLAPLGPVIEYAVRMRRFPRGSVLGEMRHPDLRIDEIEALAVLLGDFHQALAPAAPTTAWGTAAAIWAPVAGSLAELRLILRDDDRDAGLLGRVEAWLDAEFRRRESLFEERRRAGRVRECHGDLHLGNLARLDGRIVPFDALEFDEALRWIDVLNEVAFLVMDLDVHHDRLLAFRFLNRYLDVTGDHTGLPVLPFYLAYRALVRAKVQALRGLDRETRPRMRTLLEYAAAPLGGCVPRLIVMCGISGSGKSWLATRIASGIPALHVRSDIERKRLFGLAALARTASAVGSGIYADDASERTYRRLTDIAAATLRAGLPVVVDATHLRREQRAPLLAAARDARCPAVIVWCRADAATLARRLLRRDAVGGDPSEAGLEVAARQRELLEPPTPEEADRVIVVDTGHQEPSAKEILSAIAAMPGRCSERSVVR